MIPRSRRLTAPAGFSLLEMLVATTILAVVLGALFQVAASSQSIFRTQPRASDMQQRARVAADMLYRDLLMAGAGRSDLDGGALVHVLPPIVPARRGLRAADPEMSFAPDRISVVYIGRTRSLSRLVEDMGGAGADLHIDGAAPGCPPGGVCGFVGSTRALILDPTAAGAGYDLFTVTAGAAGFLSHAPPNRSFSRTYQAGALVAAVQEHVYYHDPANRRLMHYDGYQTDVPLVDDVVGLSFEYFADPQPWSVPAPTRGAVSCVHENGEPPVPLLTPLGGTTPRLMSASQFMDGPVCGIPPYRFDGDLLRLRQIRVTIRVRSATGESTDVATPPISRGPSSDAALPDYTIRFDVTPRNLNLIR